MFSLVEKIVDVSVMGNDSCKVGGDVSNPFLSTILGSQEPTIKITESALFC